MPHPRPKTLSYLSPTLHLTNEVARRFVLGRQGLRPGRRWSGKAGAAEAMRACEFTQLDPLRPVARSHDLMLHSRVVDYREGMFEELTYKDRLFFDWGGWLAAMPMDELPYWRVIMERTAVGRWGTAFAAEQQPVIERVRDALQERGPLMNRDFEAGKSFEGAYRSTKDTGLELYYLWIKGEVMTYDRRRFERVYHLRKAVAPANLAHVADEQEAERHIALKEIAWFGFTKPNAVVGGLRRKLDPTEVQGFIAGLVGEGLIVRTTVEGEKGDRFVLAEDLPTIEALAAETVPDVWSPIGATTEEETTFLAPLDVVGARGRAKPLFNFEYVWEVYKPAHLRRWGYYTMPIPYRDQLVGRIEPRLNRKSATLAIAGLWLDDEGLAGDAAFGTALARGVKRMATFAGAKAIDASGVGDMRLRKRVG